MWPLLILLSPAYASDPPEKDVTWYVIPTVSFDTDDRFGFGARAEVQQLAEGYAPYKRAFMVHAFGTVNGYQHHRVRMDLVGLGAGHRLRLTANASYRVWKNDQFYGMGNGARRERQYIGTFADEDPARKRYRYSLTQPFAHLTLRYELQPPFELVGSLNFKYSVVETYAGSLLEEVQPYGMDGGFALQAFGGVVIDTREPELTPTGGVFAELTGRVAPPIPGGQGQYVGVFASFRHYADLGPRTVFAWRVMGEYLAGEVPFYEMVHWGGSVPIQGFGGFETLRGVPFGRWRAPGKVVGNTELRITALEHSFRGNAVAWQVVPYVDAGFVFGAGPTATDPTPRLPVHPAGGLGLHVVVADSFVGRFDPAFGLDLVEEADGSTRYGRTFGFYSAFDQTF